jgi:hypothetical protein
VTSKLLKGFYTTNKKELDQNVKEVRSEFNIEGGQAFMMQYSLKKINNKMAKNNYFNKWYV